jgi:3-deoxy-D-manno-octulosonic acid kinase
MWEWLQGTNIASERRAIIDATARTVASLHAAGVYHADLNLTNILVRPSPSPQAFIIDFDRARLFPSPLLQHLRQRNLRRLRRSLQKLDPHGHRYSPDDLETFCATYNEHYAVLSTRP